MLPSTPSFELAERIFAEVAEETAKSEGALAALKAVYGWLGAILSPVVGDAGYRAIFARSVRKTRAAHPHLGDVLLSEPDRFLEPLVEHLRSEDEATIRAITIAVTASFVDLLVVLIGAELTLALLDREWSGRSALPLVQRRDE